MPKLIALSLIGLLLSGVVLGQSRTRIVGSLTDTVEKKSLYNSSVLLLRKSDSIMVRHTRSDKTGDFLPYVGDDVGMLEAPGKTIILSVFTGNHFGSGEALENAIGLVAKEVADYFDYRQ